MLKWATEGPRVIVGPGIHLDPIDLASESH